MEKTIEQEYFLELLPVDSTQEFIQGWNEWVSYCEERKNKLTKSTARKQINFLLTQSNPGEVISRSIQNSWKGLFPIDNNGKKSSVSRRKDYVTPDEYATGLKTLYEG